MEEFDPISLDPYALFLPAHECLDPFKRFFEYIETRRKGGTDVSFATESGTHYRRNLFLCQEFQRELFRIVDLYTAEFAS